MDGFVREVFFYLEYDWDWKFLEDLFLDSNVLIYGFGIEL